MMAIVTRHGIGTVSSGFDVLSREGEPARPHDSASQPAEAGPHTSARTLSAEQRAAALRSVVSMVVGDLALMLAGAPEALHAASLVSSQAS